MSATEQTQDTVTVQFFAQGWDRRRKDVLHTLKPWGEDTFEVPREDATNDDGELVEDNTYASDQLARHENAPDWIRNWRGPFYIEVRE